MGHSMGGVIIRSALNYLQEYKSIFHIFASLSSPHLGYMFNPNKLIGIGLWYLSNETNQSI